MNLDALKGWRTISFNVIVAVAAVVGTITDDMSTATAIKIIAIAAINGALRVITTTPVGKGGGV